MHFKILGSGGCQRTPRPCCDCSICSEARLKGFPFKRLTQSLYLYDINSVFDTPEDICEELNIHNIKIVDSILYTHYHPDHTMGCRVIEALREDRTDIMKPINVHIPASRIDISFNGHPSILNYFENAGYCKLFVSDDAISVGEVNIQKVKLNNGFAYGLLIEKNGRKLFYCPCHSMHIPKELTALHDIDMMVLGVGYINYLDDACTNFKRDVVPLLEHYKPSQVIFTHIEESDGMSYDDYCKFEEQYKELNIKFGYDGMDIIL